MMQKLDDIVITSQGSILTRIEDKNSPHKYETITMSELSYYSLQSDTPPLTKEVSVRDKNLDARLMTQEGDIVLGLTSGKAMVVEKDRSAKLVLSNFALLHIKDKNLVDPYYLCMLFNEKSNISRNLSSFAQSSARVSVISLSTLKDLQVDLPDIEKQRLLGRAYDLMRKITRLSRTKVNLKYRLISNQLTNSNLKEKLK